MVSRTQWAYILSFMSWWPCMVWTLCCKSAFKTSISSASAVEWLFLWGNIPSGARLYFEPRTWWRCLPSEWWWTWRSIYRGGLSWNICSHSEVVQVQWSQWPRQTPSTSEGSFVSFNYYKASNRIHLWCTGLVSHRWTWIQDFSFKLLFKAQKVVKQCVTCFSSSKFSC